MSNRSGVSYTDDTFGVAAGDYNRDGWPDLAVGTSTTGMASTPTRAPRGEAITG
jgi:hypothetical protein